MVKLQNYYGNLPTLWGFTVSIEHFWKQLIQRMSYDIVKSILIQCNKF